MRASQCLCTALSMDGRLCASLHLCQRRHHDEARKHWAAIVQASAESLWHPRSDLPFLLSSSHCQSLCGPSLSPVETSESEWAGFVLKPSNFVPYAPAHSPASSTHSELGRPSAPSCSKPSKCYSASAILSVDKALLLSAACYKGHRS